MKHENAFWELKCDSYTAMFFSKLSIEKKNRQQREQLSEQMEEIVSAMKVTHLDPNSVADELSRIREEDRILRAEISETQSEMLDKVTSQATTTTESSPISLPSQMTSQADDKTDVMQIARKMWDRWGDKVRPQQDQNASPNKQQFDVN